VAPGLPTLLGKEIVPTEMAFDAAMVASSLTWTLNHWDEFAKEIDIDPEENDVAKSRLALLAYAHSEFALSSPEAIAWQAKRDRKAAKKAAKKGATS
jgi:hypothetical protein